MCYIKLHQAIEKEIENRMICASPEDTLYHLRNIEDIIVCEACDEVFTKEDNDRWYEYFGDKYDEEQGYLASYIFNRTIESDKFDKQLWDRVAK